jgi:hypothetical protein
VSHFTRATSLCRFGSEWQTLIPTRIGHRPTLDKSLSQLVTLLLSCSHDEACDAILSGSISGMGSIDHVISHGGRTMHYEMVQTTTINQGRLFHPVSSTEGYEQRSLLYRSRLRLIMFRSPSEMTSLQRPIPPKITHELDHKRRHSCIARAQSQTTKENLSHCRGQVGLN